MRVQAQRGQSKNKDKQTTMATFYKVVTKITTRKAFVSYGGEVESQTQPSNTFKSLPMYDIYEDYFKTKEDADNFINQNSGKMIVYGK